jgi:hypothetical protein
VLWRCVGGRTCQEWHKQSEHIRTTRDSFEAAAVDGAVRVVRGIGGRAVHQKQPEQTETSEMDGGGQK